MASFVDNLSFLRMIFKTNRIATPYQGGLGSLSVLRERLNHLHRHCPSRFKPKRLATLPGPKGLGCPDLIPIVRCSPTAVILDAIPTKPKKKPLRLDGLGISVWTRWRLLAAPAHAKGL
jgi:hypothetical protein